MIKSYIKDKRNEILRLVMMIIVYLLILNLYNISLEPILYGSVLVFLILIMLCVLDFKKYCNKHNSLKIVKENFDIEKKIQSDNLIEEDYLNIIKELNKENKKLKTKLDLEKSEMIDYYTLWVHQVKNPIAGINLILQNSDSKDKDDLLEEVFKVEEYVKMVLGYLRFTDGESDLIIKEEDLNKILKESIKKYSKLFIRKKIKLSYIESNIKIITDEKWLSFAVEQIISNSLKYTKQGNISIYVKENVVCIEDTGVGIKEEDLPRIFEKGFTGYNGRMEKKSTGIGLYLTKNIIQKLGYKLEIESKINEGTKVKIILNRDILLDY